MQMTQTAILLANRSRVEGDIELIQEPLSDEEISMGHMVTAQLQYPEEKEVDIQNIHILGSVDAIILPDISIQAEGEEPKELLDNNTEKVISSFSELGMALLGKRIGEVVTLNTGTIAQVQGIEVSRFVGMVSP